MGMSCSAEQGVVTETKICSDTQTFHLEEELACLYRQVITTAIYLINIYLFIQSPIHCNVSLCQCAAGEVDFLNIGLAAARPAGSVPTLLQCS